MEGRHFFESVVGILDPEHVWHSRNVDEKEELL
jgi:hypothetical protein